MYKKLVWLIVCNSQFALASVPASTHDVKIKNLIAEIHHHRLVEAHYIAGYHNPFLLNQAEQELKNGKFDVAKSHLFCYTHKCPCGSITYHK